MEGLFHQILHVYFLVYQIDTGIRRREDAGGAIRQRCVGTLELCFLSLILASDLDRFELASQGKRNNYLPSLSRGSDLFLSV